jgi:hypothetical protein
MRTNKLDGVLRAAAGALLVSTLLAGCAKSAPVPESAPPESPPQVAPAIPDAPPPAETLPAPDAAPTQPTPEAPPPTEPSAAPKPTAAIEPSLDSMSLATPSAKMSVAVNLRYSFDSALSPNQPVTLHLAAVPRAAGTNLQVSVKPAEGLQLAEGPLNLQKVGDSNIYRQQVSVTKLDGAPSQLRVLVSMNMGEDLAFGFYTIPLNDGTNAQKQDSVKQR